MVGCLSSRHRLGGSGRSCSHFLHCSMEVAGVMYRQQVRSIRPDVKAAELKYPSGLPIVRQEVVLRLRVLPWFSVSFFFQFLLWRRLLPASLVKASPASPFFSHKAKKRRRGRKKTRSSARSSSCVPAPADKTGN